MGCACIAAIGPAVIRDIYPRRLIGVGISMVALSVAVGGAAGPTIASLILSVATWPWLFLVNIPVGMVAVPLFVTLARPGKPQRRPFDFVATVLSAAALGPLLIGVDSLGSGEHTLALGEIAFGLVCGALLVWHQLGRPNALLPLDLLKIPLLSLSVVTSICSYWAQILAYVSLPFLFETVMHPLAGRDRPVGHAMAVDDRDRRADCRSPQRALSGGDPEQHRARRHGGGPWPAGRDARSSRRTGTSPGAWRYAAWASASSRRRTTRPS